MDSRLSSSIERLEDRIAPAGLIKAMLLAGHLDLTSDAGDHAFDMSFIDPSTVVLHGHNGTSFLVDGKPQSDSVTISGITGGVKATLGAGNDTVLLGPGAFPSDVALDLGGGDNRVVTTQLAVAGNLSITGGAGADRIAFGGSKTAVGGNLTLDLGDGANSVVSSLGAFRVDGNLNVKSGAGNDSLIIGGSQYVIGGDTSVTTGGGVDVVAFIATQIGAFGGKLNVTGASATGPGEHFDFGGNKQVLFRGAIAIQMGAGNGWVALHSNHDLHAQSDVGIDTGAGADHATITAPNVALDGNVSVKSSGGANVKVVATHNLNVQGNVDVTGGSGTDHVTIAGGGQVDGTVNVDVGTGDHQTVTLAGTPSKAMVFKKAVTVTQGATSGVSTTNVLDAKFLSSFAVQAGSAVDTVKIVTAAFDGGTSFAGVDVVNVVPITPITPIVLPLLPIGSALNPLLDGPRSIAAIIASAGAVNLASLGGSVLDYSGTVDLTSAGMQNDPFRQSLAPLSAELAR